MTAPATEARPRFYFVGEVAEILRRSEPSVRWLIATKRIKTGKLGGRIVVKPEDLDAFIEAGFSDQA
jgi:excisionase family DNA binding protein|tara:strand:+ start:1015 stop:1215 length:201 start_codon:yes stop_codon:yes gene_type:complete